MPALPPWPSPRPRAASGQHLGATRTYVTGKRPKALRRHVLSCGIRDTASGNVGNEGQGFLHDALRAERMVMSGHTQVPPHRTHLVPCPQKAGVGLSSLSTPEVLAGAGLWDPPPETPGFGTFSQGRGKASSIGVRKLKLQVSSLSFQNKVAQPLSLRPQALSLASTQILFLQGTRSSLPHRGQAPLSPWNSRQRRLESMPNSNPGCSRT